MPYPDGSPTPDEIAAAQAYMQPRPPVPQAPAPVDPYLAAAQEAQAAGLLAPTAAYVPKSNPLWQGNPEDLAMAQQYMAMQASAPAPAEPSMPTSHAGQAPTPSMGAQSMALGDRAAAAYDQATTADVSGLVTGRGTPGAQAGRQSADLGVAMPVRPRGAGGASGVAKAAQGRDAAQQALLKTFDDAKAAVAEPTEAQKALRAERDQAYQQSQAYYEQAGADLRRAYDQSQADEAEVEGRLTQARKEAAEKQVVDSRTDGDRALGILAVGLAGLGDAFAAMGGQKTIHADNVLAAINEQVKLDMDQQREARSSARQKAQDIADELSIAQRHTQSTQQQALLQQSLMLDKWRNALAGIDARMLTADADATRNEAIAKIETQQADLNLQFKQQALNEKKQAAAASAGSGRTQWGSFTREQLQALKAAGRLPADGEEQLQKLLKSDKDIDGGAKPSADQAKMERLLKGVAPSVQDVRAMLAAGDVPRNPLARKVTPDILTDEQTLNREASIGAVADILLRDESGAAIGEHEQEKKLRGWGLDSGDPEVRRRGLEKMLAEYEARLGAAAPADNKPKPVRVISPGS